MGHEIVVEEEDDDEQDAGGQNNYSLANPIPIPTSPSPISGGLFDGTSGRSMQQLSAELSMELPTYDLLHNQDSYDGLGMPVHTPFQNTP